MSLLTIAGQPLIGGVSQQTPDMRRPSQAEEQINAFASPRDGLSQRPPTEHVARLLDAHSGVDGNNTVWHLIDRGAFGQYLLRLTVSGEGPRAQVFGMDGRELPIHNKDGQPVTANDLAYLQTVDPSRALKAYTLSDTTLLLNTERVARMDADKKTETRDKEALVFVKNTRQGAEFTLKINGSPVTLPAAEASQDQGAVAKVLQEGIHGVTTKRLGEVIWVQCETITEEHTEADSLYVFSGSTASVTDLPRSAPCGFTIRIQGETDEESAAYWVRFVAADGQPHKNEFVPGYWQECAAPGVHTTVDTATMPHQLVPSEDGKVFIWKPIEWGQRTAGDEQSNADPSFIGKPISGLFFYNNRLGMLAGENVLLSETGEFFNFFNTSVIQLADSDPIDIASNHALASRCLYAVPLAGKLVAFGDRAQLLIDGEPMLTPKSVSCRQMTSNRVSRDCAPLTMGRACYFAFPSGEYSGISEYAPSVYNDSFGAADMTQHVSRYLSGAVRQIVGSDAEQVMLVRTDGHRDGLYLCNLFESDGQKVQVAWSRLDFGAPVLFVAVLGSTALLVFKRGDGIYLESMRLYTAYTDDGLDFCARLDRKVASERLLPAAYDAATDTTTVRLPYTISAMERVRVINPHGGELDAHADGDRIALRGDHSAQRLLIGVEYRMWYTASRPYIRRPNGNGGYGAVRDGRTQVRYAVVHYDRTAGFGVTVVHKNGSKDTSWMVPRRLGGTRIGEGMPLQAGALRVAICAENTAFTLTIDQTSPLPCYITTIDWEVVFNTRSHNI